MNAGFLFRDLAEELYTEGMIPTKGVRASEVDMKLDEATGKMDRIKFVYDYYGGVLPTTQEEFQTKGDPLIEWEKDKGKSWREQNE